jgi:hypothetical protein
LERTDAVARSRALSIGDFRMLTILAIVAGPILVTTVVVIVFFEIKDAWDRNRLR